MATSPKSAGVNNAANIIVEKGVTKRGVALYRNDHLTDRAAWLTKLDWLPGSIRSEDTISETVIPSSFFTNDKRAHCGINKYAKHRASAVQDSNSSHDL